MGKTQTPGGRGNDKGLSFSFFSCSNGLDPGAKAMFQVFGKISEKFFWRVIGCDFEVHYQGQVVGEGDLRDR